MLVLLLVGLLICVWLLVVLRLFSLFHSLSGLGVYLLNIMLGCLSWVRTGCWLISCVLMCGCLRLVFV